MKIEHPVRVNSAQAGDVCQPEGLQIFQSEQFGQVRIVIDKNNEPLFCLTDVCQALDLTPNKVAQRLGDGVLSKYPIIDGLGREQQANFVNEEGLYDTILDSRKPEARQFRKWMTSEVLPSIRKHGAYITSDTIERALASPDFLIQLATKLKEEQALRLMAEKQNFTLHEENRYKSQIIEGLVKNISLADMRQRITQIIQKGGLSSIREDWKLLYSEFDKKHHVNVLVRMNNSSYSGNKMDYIEKELNVLPELYGLTCKLFESSYDKLMASWDKSAKRAEQKRNITNRITKL